MNNTKVYLINTLSNTHVGSGSVNYGLVDNLIQCDSITGYPNINSSSLKGALREFCKGNEFVEDVFGSDKGGNQQQGSARFFEGKLLSLPVRSNVAPYLMATTVDIMEAFKSDLEIFVGESAEPIITALDALISWATDNSGDAITFHDTLNGAVVEEIGLKAEYKAQENIDKDRITTLFGKNLVVLSTEKLKVLCNEDHLPIITRNNLDPVKGNLFYEQVLPRYTRLYFAVMDGGEGLSAKLNNAIVQFGANATIGYGYCKLEEVVKPTNTTQP